MVEGGVRRGYKNAETEMLPEVPLAPDVSTPQIAFQRPEVPCIVFLDPAENRLPYPHMVKP